MSAIVTPATPAEAKGLLRTAIRGTDPVIFLENAALYGMKGDVPDGDFALPFGRADVARAGRDATIVTYGRMLHFALAAAGQLHEEGIETEVINLRTLRPLDTESMIASVSKTHRAVVVQEQWKPFGAAGEIAATIYEHVFDELDAPVERVTGADVPMPYARNLELLATPHEGDIVKAVKKTLYKA